MSDDNGRDERLISDMSRCALAGRADASRETVTITDFSACEPSAFVSPQPQHPGVWQLLDYEAGEVQGVALYGTENTHAQPIKIPLTKLRLAGWYEVRYAMWDPFGPSDRPPGEGIRAMLTDDPNWSVWHAEQFKKIDGYGKAEIFIEHVWKIADLTDQDLHLAQLTWWKGLTLRCALAGIKLIPIETPERVNTHSDTWRLAEYEAPDCGVDRGVAIEVDEDCRGGEIVLPLGDASLEGWYDIYVGLYDPGSPYDRFFYTGVDLKLSNERSFTHLALHSPRPARESERPPTERGVTRERLWQRSKLDGRNIHLRQRMELDTVPHVHSFRPDFAPFNIRCGIAWFRLVPAQEPEESEAPVLEKTPRRVSGNDLGHHLMRTEGEVRAVLDGFRHEACNTIVLDINSAGDKPRYPTAIGEVMDRYEVELRIMDRLMVESNAAMIRNGVNCLAVWADEVKRMEMDFWIYFRVGAWGYAQPFQTFGGPFFRDHPEFLAVDKDGTPWHTMSYAFPEVRRYMTSLFREAIQISRSQGGQCDGIVVGFSRGPIFFAYEPHVCEAFEKEVGEDPRQLPDDDPRWLKFRAGYLSALMVELKEMLAEESAAQGSEIKLIAQSYYCEAICMRYGLDVRDWVERGLVDILSGEEREGYNSREFYKEIRALAEGKVEVLIGYEDCLNDSESPAADDGPRDKTFEEIHPTRQKGRLVVGRSLPPMDRTPAPGEVTAQARVERIQGLNIGKEGYKSGL